MHGPLPWHMLLVLALLAVAQCDMFSARDSETPDPSSGAEAQWVAFEDLLESTGYQFSFSDYGQVLAADFVYQQGTGPTQSRDDMIVRLRAIEPLQPGVTWTVDPPPLLSIEDPVSHIEDAAYTVSVGPTEIYTGFSDFGVSYVAGIWVIVYWHDYPDVTVDGRSYFNPDFVDEGTP